MTIYNRDVFPVNEPRATAQENSKAINRLAEITVGNSNSLEVRLESIKTSVALDAADLDLYEAVMTPGPPIKFHPSGTTMLELSSEADVNLATLTGGASQSTESVFEIYNNSGARLLRVFESGNAGRLELGEGGTGTFSPAINIDGGTTGTPRINIRDNGSNGLTLTHDNTSNIGTVNSVIGALYLYSANTLKMYLSAGSGIYMRPDGATDTHTFGDDFYLLGDSNGTPTLRLQKSAGGTANLQFYSGGAVAGSITVNADEEMIFTGRTERAADPTAGVDLVATQWSIHKNTSSGNVYLAYNDGGSIKKVQLT